MADLRPQMDPDGLEHVGSILARVLLALAVRCVLTRRGDAS
ncbi:hypothetical protein [Arsenicicoccus dermatophilus]|nr:hypothetical protein [Arsenicicoccus dermatophilus]